MTLHTLKILTFAWVRTQTGAPEFEVQTKAATVGALLEELIATRPGWEKLVGRQEAIRCAVDQVFAERHTSLDGVREVAFFPPVTGG